MLSSQVDSENCRRIKRRVYLPDVDEFNASSSALTGEVLGSVLSVSPTRSKVLKEGYISDLTRAGGISPCSLMLGLLYINRLSTLNGRYVKSMSSRDLFLISMVVASKYMNDEGEMEALTNSDWAEIGSKPKVALDRMELNFLQAIDWKLYVPLDEYYAFVTGIEGRIALKQATARGWLTYSDLAVIWEATNLQDTMLLASKQAAKVALGSTCIYLVCLATLLATPHLMQMASTSGSTLSSSSPSSPPSVPNMDASSFLHDLAGQPPYMADMTEPRNLSSPWNWPATGDTSYILGGQLWMEENGRGPVRDAHPPPPPLLLESRNKFWTLSLLLVGWSELWSKAGTGDGLSGTGDGLSGTEKGLSGTGGRWSGTDNGSSCTGGGSSRDVGKPGLLNGTVCPLCSSGPSRLSPMTSSLPALVARPWYGLGTPLSHGRPRLDHTNLWRSNNSGNEVIGNGTIFSCEDEAGCPEGTTADQGMPLWPPDARWDTRGLVEDLCTLLTFTYI